MRVLGIEASRVVLIDEVLAVLGAYDIGIDRRHVELVADIMTTRGSFHCTPRAPPGKKLPPSKL